MLKATSFKSLQVLACICMIFLFLGIPATVSAESTSVENRSIEIDINLDGCPEILNFSTDSVLLTDSIQGITKQVPVKGDVVDIKAVDADLDGLMDLKVWIANAKSQIISNRELSLLLEPAPEDIDNAYFYEIYNTGAEVDNIWDTVVGDFDNDGKKDILVPTQTPYRALAVYESTGDNNSFTRVFQTPNGATSGAFTKMAVGDTDGDGHKELISGAAGTLGTIKLFEHVSDNNYVERSIGIAHSGPSARRVLIGDTDGDGKMEIIVGYGDVSGGHIYIHEHCGLQGQNTYQLVYEYHTVSYLFYMAIGDSDNDGYQEIILGLGGFGFTEPYIRRLEYTPFVSTVNQDHYVHSIVLSGTGEPGLLSIPHVADVDGDGDNELIFGGSCGGGAVFVFESPSNNTYQKVFKANGIDGSVLRIVTGPLNGSDYPAIVSGSFGGELSMWTYTGCPYCREPYKNILSPAIFVNSDIRGLGMGYLDPGSRVDIAVGEHYQMLRVYEQAPPEQISQLVAITD